MPCRRRPGRNGSTRSDKPAGASQVPFPIPGRRRMDGEVRRFHPEPSRDVLPAVQRGGDFVDHGGSGRIQHEIRRGVSGKIRICVRTFFRCPGRRLPRPLGQPHRVQATGWRKAPFAAPIMGEAVVAHVIVEIADHCARDDPPPKLMQVLASALVAFLSSARRRRTF